MTMKGALTRGISSDRFPQTLLHRGFHIMKPSLLIIGGSCFAGRVLVEEKLGTGDYDLFVLHRGSRLLNLEGVTELRARSHDCP
jgi:hypothetical protein